MMRMARCFWGLGVVLCLLVVNPVWADCQTTYDQAVGLLNSVQAKVTQNEHPNPDAFAAEFKGVVDKLQSEKCMPELKKLTEYINEEQQKYPVIPADEAHPAPIED